MALRNGPWKDNKTHSEPNSRKKRREDVTKSDNAGGDQGGFGFSSMQAAVMGILSAVYVATMHRSLPGGDAGEFGPELSLVQVVCVGLFS